MQNQPDNENLHKDRMIDYFARIDERTKNIVSEISELKIEFKSHNEEMRRKLEQYRNDTKQELKDFEELIDDRYVRKERFTVVEKLVFGLVGLILIAVMSAVLGTVILK